jgi:Fe2+ or Zn2+ uptake regulation protein
MILLLESFSMTRDKATHRLRATGLTPTTQRVAILEFLDSVDVHPTVDEVFRAVSVEHPAISKATIYNGLRALVDAGLACELTIGKDAARYDRCEETPHSHFRCSECQRLYDVHVEESIRVGSLVEGHEVTSVCTYLHGVCADCRARRKGDTGA